MVSAAINDPEHPVVIMGITEENIRRLKAGNPILKQFKDMGSILPGKISVIYGHTEDDLKRTLSEATNGKLAEYERSDPRALEFQKIIAENAHTLVCTVGLPRSGKTTWCRGQGWPIVNPDSIRLAIHGQRFISEAEPFVWATAKAMVRSLFLAGHNVVLLDATGNSRKRRDEWQSQNWETYFQVIDTPAAVCLERATAEADHAIIPVIERMAAEHEPLGEDERKWP